MSAFISIATCLGNTDNNNRSYKNRKKYMLSTDALLVIYTLFFVFFCTKQTKILKMLKAHDALLIDLVTPTVNSTLFYLTSEIRYHLAIRSHPTQLLHLITRRH